MYNKPSSSNHHDLKWQYQVGGDTREISQLKSSTDQKL